MLIVYRIAKLNLGSMANQTCAAAPTAVALDLALDLADPVSVMAAVVVLEWVLAGVKSMCRMLVCPHD
jgi:hypothetical protein